MRVIRLLLLVLLPAIVSPARATDEADDWKLIGGMLSLMQQFVHLAAQSPDPKALDKSMDAMLAGENAQANRLASGLMEEILQDVPLEQRSAFVSIGRDLLTLARRERACQRRTGLAAFLRARLGGPIAGRGPAGAQGAQCHGPAVLGRAAIRRGREARRPHRG